MMKWLLSLLIVFTQTAFADENFKADLENYIQIHKARAEFLFSKRSEITGVEIIIADRASNIASRFGHALIRFVDQDNLWANDIVISFGALSDSEKLSLVKGVFGGYPILPEVMTLHEYWGRYTQVEKRDLRRFVLNLEKKQLDKLLDVSFDYIKDPQKLKNYTFTKNNCVGVISKFLIEAKLTVDDKQAIIPSRIHKWLKKNDLTVFPELTMKNPAAIEKKLADLNIAKTPAEEFIRNFNLNELSYIYFNKKELKFSQIKAISAHLLANNFEMDDAFSFTNIHPKLYNRCNTLSCFREFDQFEKTLKISDQLDVITYRLQENDELQDLYLNHRKFEKWDLIEAQGFKTSNNNFKLKIKKNKIHFSTNAIRNIDHESQAISTPLQFELKGDKVLLLNTEVGKVQNGKLTLKDNLRLVLHQAGNDMILSLIKI